MNLGVLTLSLSLSLYLSVSVSLSLFNSATISPHYSNEVCFF